MSNAYDTPRSHQALLYNITWKTRIARAHPSGSPCLHLNSPFPVLQLVSIFAALSYITHRFQVTGLKSKGRSADATHSSHVLINRKESMAAPRRPSYSPLLLHRIWREWRRRKQRSSRQSWVWCVSSREESGGGGTQNKKFKRTNSRNIFSRLSRTELTHTPFPLTADFADFFSPFLSVVLCPRIFSPSWPSVSVHLWNWIFSHPYEFLNWHLHTHTHTHRKR